MENQSQGFQSDEMFDLYEIVKLKTQYLEKTKA